MGAAGLVSLPDDRGIMGLRIALSGVNERRVPLTASVPVMRTPRSVRNKVASRPMPPARSHVIGLAEAAAGAGVDDDDVERLQVVADAVSSASTSLCRHHMAIGEMTEIELHAWPHAPVEGTSSMVMARLSPSMIDAKCQGASRWVPAWVVNLMCSIAQPSPSGKSAGSPGKRRHTSGAVSRCDR